MPGPGSFSPSHKHIGTGAAGTAGGSVRNGSAGNYTAAGSASGSSSRPRVQKAPKVTPFRLPEEADLTREELSVIDLPISKDYLIEGQAGSGKTVTALYRAKRISERSREPVIFLLPDHKDMLSLRAAVRGNREFDGVLIDTYTSWIKDFYKLVLKKKVPKTDAFGSERAETDWGQVARDSYSGVDTYQHIVIDGGEEFPPDLLKALSLAACYVTCFMDPDKAAKKGRTSVAEACSRLLIEAPRTITGTPGSYFGGGAAAGVPADGSCPTEQDVIDLLESAVTDGLSLKNNRQLYLLVADMLAKLYIREGTYKEAINYLMDIVDSGADVPDSIRLSYLYAQIMTENIERFYKEPSYWFRRLDQIGPASYPERAELYRTFLLRLKEILKNDPGAVVNLDRFEKKEEKYTGLTPESARADAGTARPAAMIASSLVPSDVFDETDGPRLRKMLSEHNPDLEDKKRIKGLISDYYFDEPLKKNIFRAIIEDDLAKEIAEQKSLDAVKIMRYVVKLSGSRGIDKKLSEAAILCWWEALREE